VSPSAPRLDTEPTAVVVPHQALYRRWRAQTFSEIVGQTAVVETLRNAVRANRVSHAVLFVGPRGTGKTSLARILAKALNCTDLRDGDPCDACAACVAIREGRALDLVEIDAASNRGIDAIRDLRERIHYAPTDLRRKVYILDEAHQITKDAWNALLKSLEEPPEFVAFMFASTHPQDFPPAILSRLQRYDVRRLSVEEIEGKLTRILAAESVNAEPGAVRLIARLAAGGMRDAESMLDQVLASAGAAIDEPVIRDLLGLADADAVERLSGALVDGDAGAGLRVLDELDDRGRDVAVVLDQVVEQIRSELTSAIRPDGNPTRATALAAAAHRLAAIDPERRGVGGLRFQLELAILDAATRPAASGIAVRGPRAEPAPAAPRPESLVLGAEASDQAPANGSSPTSSPAPRDSGEERGSGRPTAGPGGRKADPAGGAREAAAGEAIAAEDTPAASPATANRASRPTTTDRSKPAPPAEPTNPEDRSRPDAASSARPATGGSIEDLRAAWPEIVAVLSQNPPVKPLIAACRPVSVEGVVVTLGFPEDQAFLKVALERRQSLLEEGIGRVLGRAVNVRCVATNLEDVPAVPTGDAADLITEARRIFAEDLVDVGEVS
jgi:DNA polymerase III subunit gamma/tau